ncbi:MAG: cohesin domain-containing protein, partial [Candidatus Bathyarchaeales archaeon]
MNGKSLKALSILVSMLMLLSLLGAFPVKAVGEGYATIEVSDTYLTTPPYHVGDTFLVRVRIKNYDQVASWQVRLLYDKSLLTIVSADNVAYASDFIFPTGTYDPISASLGAW